MFYFRAEAMGFFSRSKPKNKVPVVRPKPRKAPEFVRDEPETADYRGVEVIPHPSGHCGAVEKIAGQRLLADEAPVLPLPDCDAEECNCRYAQYKDRRLDARRDADVGISNVASSMGIDSGRAEEPGRRAVDRRYR